MGCMDAHLLTRTIISVPTSKHMRVQLLLVALLALVLLAVVPQAAAAPPFIFCEDGVENENLPTIPDENLIDVYYLEAPVFEGFYGPVFGLINGYHTAVGFYDKTSGTNWTIDYEAYAEVLNATAPHLITYPNGSVDLYWNNAGAVCIRASVNESYWSHKITYMTSISGAVFNAYFNWTQQYNATHTIYELWDVFEEFDDQYSAPPFLGAQTCDTFAWDSWAFLFSAGAVFSPQLVARHDRVCIFSAEPQLVDHTDPAVYADIVAFYSAFHTGKGLSFASVIEVLMDLTRVHKYLYYGGQYYLLQMHLPLLALRYDPAPLPSLGQQVLPPQQKLSAQ